MGTIGRSPRAASRAWPLRFAFCAWNLTLLFALLTFARCALAQTSTQQRVYGAASSTTTTAVLPAYNKDSATGALSELPGAPFADRLEGGLLAIDGQGKFLFVLNPVSNNISMFQIDGSTGALAEVPNSPFAVGPTVNPSVAPSLPISLAAEASGKFLYVGYANGDSSTTSALAPFTIDAANLRLTLTAQQTLDFGNGAPVQLQSDQKGLHLYMGLGPGGNQTTSSAGTLVFAINAADGTLTGTGNAGGGTDRGRAIAVDPQGRFFFDGWGQVSGFLDSGLISPVDGTSSVSSTIELGSGVFPSVLLVDSSGKFLYAQTNSGLLIYSIDGASGALTLLSGPLPAFRFANGKVAADPMGPYLYSLESTGVDVFQIDAVTGNLTEVPGAPFSTGATGTVGALGLAISGSGGQGVSGPAAQVFPASASLGEWTVGHNSATKIVSVVNVGNQILAITGISLGGANAGDFAQSSTCGATLAANANCSVSVVFTPSLVGTEQATLQVSDNAPGSPQTATLSGIGVGAQGSVTLAPGSVSFGPLAQGASVSRTVQLTNSGTGPLHVASVVASGSNPGDFSQTNTCTAAAVAVQASCTITVTFAPQSQGQRTASLVITDDGGGSPQSLALSGSGAASFLLSAGAGSTSATVSAGQTATYMLQVMPGPGFSGSVAFTCAGAPLAAACSVSPGSVAVSSGIASAIQVQVTTTGSGLLVPQRLDAPKSPTWPLLLLCLLASLLWFFANLQSGQERRRLGFAYVGVMFAVLACSFAGCGGGSSPAAPSAALTPAPQPQTVTPKGTSVLTLEGQSGALPQQTLQLTLTVQ